MRSLPRITADSFRNSGVKGFGFGDVHQAGQMAVEGFDRVAATGARFVRSAFVPELIGDRYEIPAQQLSELARSVSELQRRGVYTIVLMAIPEEQHARLWVDAALRQSVAALWGRIARAFRGRTAVAGFDLLNEPKLTGPGQDAPYWELAELMVEAVRAVDPKRVCIVSTWPGGLCQTNPEWGQWIKHIPGTVLTAHLYSPFEFTHADLMDWTTPGKQFDPYMHTTLQAIHTALLWLRDHSIKTGQPVWIGEMSCQQDRPGAAEWARHAVEMCEAAGFSWSWHYFLGWPGWHPNPETLQFLQAAFRRK